MSTGAKSYWHRGGDTPLLGVTIGTHFASIAERCADCAAIISMPQQRRLGYAELADEIDLVARGLLAMGFGRGDRIGIWSTNNIEWLLVQMATARIGAILVNINPAYRSEELKYALRQSAVNGLITIPRFRGSHYSDMLQELIPELSRPGQRIENSEFPDLSNIILYDPADPGATEIPAKGFTPWQELLKAAKTVTAQELEAQAATLDCDDVINIQYTSGTTGFPKAVMLTHHNILNNARFTAAAMHFGETDRLAVAVPFYHCFGMVLANLMCLSVGAAIVISCEHFDAGRVLDSIAAERCSAVHGVPTMFIEMLDHENFAEFDLASLRTGIMAGAPCPAELMHRVIDNMHLAEILIGYGETEASPLTHLTAREDSLERRTETVGRNLPHQEVKIIDPQTGDTVVRGEIGEICFRGYHVMRGYYAEADKTREAIDAAGWLHSGDLGCMDDEGYLKITGRRKEMIIRGGENIYPREIEDLIFTHPKVAEVAVFGVPDARLGEQVAAWIQLHTGCDADAAEIQAFCKDRIAHFKIPHIVRFVDQMPMTVTGKLQKFRMREAMIEELETRRT